MLLSIRESRILVTYEEMQSDQFVLWTLLNIYDVGVNVTATSQRWNPDMFAVIESPL